jgi:hypothetical protein
MRKWLAIWALLVGLPITLAWAANTQLSNLTAGGAVSATDLFYNVQSAGSGGVKTTAAQFATFAWTNPVITGSLTATGLVTNADLVNPATTVNGQTCTLGSTCTAPAAAGTLTGTTLAAGVTASSLTSTGTLAGLTVTGSFTATGLVTNADLAGSIAAAKLIGTDIATVGTLTSGTAGTGFVIGGTTMTLGSDATGDMYYRNSSGVLTRLAVCTGTNVLGASGGLPACVAQSGGGGTPGGANTNVQFNNSSAFGGDAGFTYAGTGQVTITNSTVNTTPLTMTGQSLTGTDTHSFLSMTGTLNTSGAVDVIALHETCTSCASANLFNLYGGAAGTTSEFKVSPTGVVTAANSVVTLNNFVISNGGAVVTANSQNEIQFNQGTNLQVFWNNTGPQWQLNVTDLAMELAANYKVAWGATADSTGTLDTFLIRKGAANVAFGTTDAAAPVAQTISMQNVVAGTSNTAGANTTIKGSIGTGTGVGGDIIFQAARAGTTGTAQNALQTVFTVKNTGVIQDNVVFSAAGTPLPTCNAGAEGSRGAVSDALTPTFLTAYVSGGAVHASVYCDGTSWKTD